MMPQPATEAERLRALGLALVHAVRSPLAAIRALAEERHGSAAGASWGEGLALIDGQVERVDAMLGDFAALVRARPARRRRVLLRELVDRACGAVVRRETMAAVPVLIEAPNDEVAVDAAQIERLLIELLTNALEAPGVTSVRLRASCEPSTLRLLVSDDGAGVPAAIRSRVGEPFVSTKPWGTGLGWALCQLNARAHGGELMIDSAEPGTIASVVLPLRDEG